MFGQRADDVVGFDTGYAQHRQAERGDGLDQRRNLGAQFIRHWRAMRLVLLEEVIAECTARRIEDDGDQLRVVFLEDPVQHVEDAEHGASRFTGRTGERRQRVERAV